ncbi:CDP-alcohol phosphatidyltransferase family protein [Alteribacillus sp. JSM 102045]|uniref:CDP-alcohol phosphatidyltransferase family protein n=1 Tax=Alteribacillus sp. JSM 102045 TaxID=1562101 RepID=UPI0035BEF804
MLDTHARKYIDPFIDFTAKKLSRWGVTANQVTIVGFLLGASVGVLIYIDQLAYALFALWLSGFLDVVDGALARETTPSAWGTLMDITFDRLVEISVILGLAFRFPEAMWALLILTASFILSMTIFLTVGALADKQGKKSFYYQAGLAERTESFILLSIMMIWTDYIAVLALVFLGMVLFTAVQRLKEAKSIL